MWGVYKLVLVCVILGLAYSIGFSKGIKYEDYRVVRVIDGDTLMMLNRRDGREIRLRIWGIEAPEPGECFAEESSQTLKRLINEKPELSIFGYDGFGRILARVFVDGEDIGKKMVEVGAAFSFDGADVHDDLKPSEEYINELRISEEMARERTTGIWDECVRFKDNEI